MTRFKDKLLNLRQLIRDEGGDDLTQSASVPEYEPKSAPFVLSSGAQVLVDKLNAAVDVDIYAYQQTPDPGVQMHSSCVANAGAANSDAGGGQYGSLSGSGADMGQLAQDMLTVVTSWPADMAEKQKSMGCFLADVQVQSLFFPKNGKSLFDQHTKEKMGLDNQLLFRFLYADLDAAREDPDLYLSSRHVVEQLQRIVSMYTQGNVANTLTAFQRVQGENPNDKLTAFVAAHIFYHRAVRGHSQFLPKARQAAKKAGAGHDKLNPSILARFRYHLMAIDAYFSPKRQLELLKEFELLTPPKEQYADNPYFALYIKSMIHLSRTDMTLWSEAEIQAIKSLAFEVIGGAFIYNVFFFERLHNKLFNQGQDTSELFSSLLNIHIQLAGIESGLASYQEACQEMAEVNAPQNKLAYSWTINQDLFKKCMAHMPTPAAEDVLMNINLNGDMFAPTLELDQSLREKEMMIGPFWPVWIGKLMPRPSIYDPHNLPDQIARTEINFLRACEEIVDALQEDENQIIDHDKWPYSKPYQTQYSYDRIMSAGMGRTYTNLSFAPKNKVLKNHYEVWGAEMPRGLLFSEIVLNKAQNAGFAGVKEIQTFFDGVSKVKVDSEYGLAAKQKKAWEEYLKKQQALNNKGAQFDGRDFLQHLMADIWWLFVFVIPAALAVFLLMSNSEGLSSAFLMFVLVVLGLVIFLGLYAAITKGMAEKSGGDKNNKQIQLDENGNVIAPDDDSN